MGILDRALGIDSIYESDPIELEEVDDSLADLPPDDDADDHVPGPEDLVGVVIDDREEEETI